MAKPEMTITRLYELVDVDLLRGRVVPRGAHAWVSSRVDKDGYNHCSIDRRSYKAARVIWSFANGMFPPAGMQVDHINGVRNDDRLCNLRVVTIRQNNMNRRRIGVSWHKQAERWRARVRDTRGDLHSSDHLSREAAVEAYRAAHVRFFGEFSPWYQPASAISVET